MFVLFGHDVMQFDPAGPRQNCCAFTTSGAVPPRGPGLVGSKGATHDRTPAAVEDGIFPSASGFPSDGSLRSSAVCVAVETGLLASEVLSALPSPTSDFVTVTSAESG